MSWTIGNEEMRRSDASIHNLGQHIAHVLPARDWRVVRSLFNRYGDSFSYTPADAGRIAQVLRTAANDSKMPADWAQDARQLAQSAQAAADTRQHWHWR